MDQKLKKDAGKLRFDLIPPEALIALAEIYTFGLEKGYDEESWRKVDKKRYIASFMRHFNDWRMDNTGKDEESGYHHVKHLLWNAVALTMKTCYMDEDIDNPKGLKWDNCDICRNYLSKKCKDCSDGEYYLES